MSKTPFPLVDVTDHWGRLNDELVRLVDYVPEGRMGWSPRPELWSFRGILLHVAVARDDWMGAVVKDGGEAPNVLEEGQSREGIQQQLRRSWERVQRFLADPANLSRDYERSGEGRVRRLSGHWIAFHLLEHDIHHRADIFHYLALLGIDHPDVGTP